ncbi:MAG: tight adherence protein B [Acidimicrobiales bacterium]|jgi:tight adherence protein B
MDALVMAAIGAMLAVGLLATMFTLMGVRMFSGFGDRFSHAQQSAQHLVVWVVAGFAAAAVVWVWTNWPVGGLWAFAGVLSVPLLKGERPSAADEIVKVEAIATWTEQIRDTMNASAGLQQSLVATATNGPAAIQTELTAFARRAPRGDLAGALRQLGIDLGHPAADLVIAGLVSASELDAGRLVPLLTRLASSIRDEAHMRVRIEVSRARVRTSMKIVGFFVGLTMLLMIVVGRELLRGYESAAGQVWLLIVGTVVVLAIWITRKLAEIPQPERFVARRPSS